VYGASSIMVCSLTRAAAKEVTGRVDLPKGCVGTLHSHCFRGLDRPKMAETSDGIKGWNDWVDGNGYPATLKIDPKGGKDVDWNPVERRPGFTDGEDLLARQMILRARMVPADLWPPKVQAFAAKWGRYKDESNTADFTDLLDRALHDLERAPTDPAVMLVDEAQDHSRLELALIRKWAGQAEQLVVVGDQDQAIFEWRGADPSAMNHDGLASEITLSRSRRVPAAVHRYAVQWISQIADRRPVSYEPRFNDPDDEQSGVAEGSVERSGVRLASPGPLVTRLAADLEAGHTVMVLASCAYMLDPLIRQLRADGIPFGNEYRPSHGGWNPMRGVERLRSLLAPSPAVWGSQARPWTWEDIDRWLEPFKARGQLTHGAKTRVEQLARPDRFDGTVRQADFDHVFGLFDPPDLADPLMNVDTDPVATAQWWHASLIESRKKQARYGVRVMEKQGPAAITETPRLTIGTIHSVKGGEADVVYIFPDLSRQGYQEGWATSAGRPQTRRVFYVAFTRARERLVLGSPSEQAFLQFPPQEAL
jgi:DNA helicase II / ATP-dependent DNA helicase PcrA